MSWQLFVNRLGAEVDSFLQLPLTYEVGEVPPANGFCVFEGQYVTDDFLLAHQVA
jgi:hypothetical protein